MQLEIRPSIRNRVLELNEQAKRIIAKHGFPIDAQLLFGNGLTQHQLRFPAKSYGKQVVRTIHFIGEKSSKPSDTPLENWHTVVLETDARDRETIRRQNRTIESRSAINETERAHEGIQAEAIHGMSLQKGQHVMELGPGAGKALARMFKKGVKVTAIDHSPQAVENLKRKFATEIETGQLTLHGAQYTDPALTASLPRSGVDHAFTFDGTGQHPQLSELFKTIHRCLKPGGKFTLLQTTPFYKHLTAQLESVGFKVEKVKVQELLPSQKLQDGRTIESYTTTITAVKA